VIFGFLAVMGVVGSLIVSNARQPSRAGRGELPHRVALRQLDTLATALGRYRFHTGSYPDAQQGLRALVRDPGLEAWLGPYVSGLRDDPWGAPYPYAPPLTNGLPPRLFSCGPDGRPGTPDDLRPDPLAFEVGSDWTSGWVRAAERMPGVRVLLTAPPLPEDAP
jgi:general secretion pathway protein G